MVVLHCMSAALTGCGGADVTSPPIATSVSVEPSSAVLEIGTPQTFRAQIFDASGRSMAGIPIWSVGNVSVASLNGAGLVEGLSPGNTEVSAAYEGASGSAILTIEDTQMPALTVSLPAGGGDVAGKISIPGGVSDNHKVSSITLSVDDTTIIRLSPGSKSVGSFTLVWDSKGFDVGPHDLVVDASDPSGNNARASVSVNLIPAMIIADSSMPLAAVGSDYDHTLTTVGASDPVNWSILNGDLPAGLSLDAVGGRLRGTPTIHGTSHFTIKAEDAVQSATKTFSIQVNRQLLIAASSLALKSGVSGVAYSDTLTASGGELPYSWSVLSGSLPSGLSLSTSGIVSGVPSIGEAGSSEFVVGVLSSDGQTANGSTVLEVFDEFSISTTWLGPGTVPEELDRIIDVTGGDPDGPTEWSLVSGSLPEGLSLSTLDRGLKLHGKPALEGNKSFTLKAESSDGQEDTQEIIMVINPATSFVVTGWATTDTSIVNGRYQCTAQINIRASGGPSTDKVEWEEAYEGYPHGYAAGFYTWITPENGSTTYYTYLTKQQLTDQYGKSILRNGQTLNSGDIVFSRGVPYELSLLVRTTTGGFYDDHSLGSYLTLSTEIPISCF